MGHKGWKDPEVEEQFAPDRTIFALAFTKKQAEKTSGKAQASKTLANKDRIVSYIQMQNGAGTSEIAAQIELSNARTRVLPAELISEGRIYLEGNGRAEILCANEELNISVHQNAKGKVKNAQAALESLKKKYNICPSTISHSVSATVT